MARFRQRSSGKLLLMAVGGLLVLVIGATEFLSSTSNGIGPYQAILILLGLCIFLLGLFPSNQWSSKLVLILSSFVVSVILIEGGLFLAYRANVTVTFPDTSELLNDDVLGKRTPPGATGHDSRGWRNETAIDKADIVVIGDSQTWGVNATLTEAYPAVLARLSGQVVYSMAQGSYGAVQYRVLSEEAIQLSPDRVIVGMYFGNDFADAYTLVYNHSRYEDVRDPSFDLSAITQTIKEQAIQVQPGGSSNLTESDNGADLTFWEQFRSGTYLGKFLTSAGVFDRVSTGTNEQNITTYRQMVAQSPDIFSIYQQDNWETFLTPAYRYLVQNLENPIIQEGVRITRSEYLEMQEMMAASDIAFLVVLIPTKELVYAPYIDSLSDSYQSLVTQERELRDSFIELFEANQIQYVDTLPSLRLAVENDNHIYPSTFDGHPNANGYQVIAETIWAYINTQ